MVSSVMDTPGMYRKDITERILSLTLEIIYLLTGEDYTVVRKTSSESVTSHPHVSEVRSRSPITEALPHSSILNREDQEKILEITKIMTELLTREVPVRSQDVTVHFSMEEWEYLEEHKEQYKEILPAVKYNQNFTENLSGSSNSKVVVKEIMQQSAEEHTMTQMIYPEQHVIALSSHYPPPLDTGHTGGELFPPPEPGHSFQQEALPSNPPSSACKKCLNQNITCCSHLKKFACSSCERRFSRKVNLIQHERIHSSVRPHSCSECERSFVWKSDLAKHQRIHTQERPYACQKCGDSFGKNVDLIEHTRCHEKKKGYSCSVCGQIFLYESYLTRHLRTCTGKRKYPCPHCAKCCKSKAALVQHRRCHSEEKPFSCSKCGKGFIRELELVAHERSHEGEKPHTCSVCEKSFAYKESLTKHQRVHKGGTPTPFSCSKCGKGFLWELELVAHERSHKGEKPHTCSVCDKSFARKQSLSTHQRVHTGDIHAQKAGNVLPNNQI